MYTSAALLKIIFLALMIIASISLGWQLREFFNKTITCPWQKCKYNRQEECVKRACVELEHFIPDEQHRGLVCVSYDPKEQEEIHIDTGA